MASNSFNLIFFFFFILPIFINFATTKAEDPPFMFRFCSHNTTDTTYQTNLKTLFSTLISNAKMDTFHNDTVKNTVFGLFMCRDDMSGLPCYQCVQNATDKLTSDPECSLSKQALIWYDECMVRYSNVSFFSTLTTEPKICTFSNAKISNNVTTFKNILSKTMKRTIKEAENSPKGDWYATQLQNVFASQTLYCVAQCTKDISRHDCATCLANATNMLLLGDKQGGRVLFPSCNVRFELYPFFQFDSFSSSNGITLVPKTMYRYPLSDPEYSGYISHNCSSHVQTLQNDDVVSFSSNLTILLQYLTSNATDGAEFQTRLGPLRGLYMCRGDVAALAVCGECVRNASDRALSECRFAREGVVWFEYCLVRYSDRDFFSRVETWPRYEILNVTSGAAVVDDIAITLATNLATIANRTGDSGVRYRHDTVVLEEGQKLYMAAQCTRDLSSDDCDACLSDVIGSAIPWRRLGSVGGRVLYPSCVLRFEMFQFLNNWVPPPPPPPPPLPQPARFPPPAETRNESRRKIVVYVASAVIIPLILFSFACYFTRRKSKNYKTILKENFGHESNAVEPLQFDLAIIKAATTNFSHENKIGKGGFGEVYKGTLIDGRHIAVKRLSRTSKQGAQEFKNEVLLIAKLQHRNLVEFVGFCLDEEEKILIYEYVSNKSLDHFLFDTKLQKEFTWCQRYKIIRGIAWGILYLHEYSRLKVIHRDLKPSNILLDENMNPKISDFGLARIVEIDQQEGSTNRIIGTYGYMAPEYAMLGQFSEKSDVYSFGVMILEIITGKKNIGSYESYDVVDGLLSFVWRQWKDHTPLNILDKNLIKEYSKREVIKCIQIGLLCVQENPDIRPSMLTIVSYLSNPSAELPSPLEPAFILHGKMNRKVVTYESNSSQSATNSMSFSVNEMSISEFYPR